MTAASIPTFQEQPTAKNQSLHVKQEQSSAIKGGGWNTLRTRQTLAGTFATAAGAVVTGFAATALSGINPAMPLIATGGVAIALLGVNIFNQGVFGDKYKETLAKIGLRPSDISAFMGFLAVGAFAANAINAFVTGAAVIGAGATGVAATLGQVEALFLTVSATFFTILSASSLKESIDARRESKHMPQEEGLQVKQENSSYTKGLHLPSWKGLTPNQAAASLIGAGALVIAAGGVMMGSALSGGPLIVVAGALYTAWGSMFLQNPLKPKETSPQQAERDSDFDVTVSAYSNEENPSEKHKTDSLEIKSKLFNIELDLNAIKEMTDKLANDTDQVKMPEAHTQQLNR